MGQQKGKGKKNGGNKLRSPRSLEPLLQNPNYLIELAQTRGKRKGSSELDAQIPRIIKDICDPMVKVDMNVYGMYLIQEPVYTRLCQMLQYLYMINHQYDIALCNYLGSINTPVQPVYPQQPQPQQQYLDPSEVVYYGYGSGYSEINICVQQQQPMPQQQSMQQPLMDHHTDIEMMKGLLNLARANQDVYGGALTAIVNCHDLYLSQGIFSTAPIDVYINQNRDNARFISAPDMIGVEYYEKKKIVDNSNRRERRNRDDVRNG